MVHSGTALIAVPATLLLYSLSAFGHDCGHHGGCAPAWNHHGDCYGCGLSGRSSSAANPGSAQPGFGRVKSQTLEGRIAEVIFLPGGSPEDAMIEVRVVHDGGSTLVRLGPAGFLRQNQLSLREGDIITVTGYAVAAGPDDLLVAIEIAKQGKVVRLRDTRGRALW